MPSTGTDWLDIVLFAGIALVLAGTGFFGAVEAWRHWSYNRRRRN
jgi:hypothetical protein